MARLNKTEKLMHNAATGKDPFEAKVFNELLDFYEKLDYLENQKNIDIINYLYCRDHKRETFDNIARSFYLSVSKLEGNRKKYQKMYTYFHNEMSKDITDAA